MNERERLGREIEKAIKKKDLTLKEVSAATGIPVSTIHRWICNELPTGAIMILKLIKFLEIEYI
ncbi:MAG: helix-turn-helix transcriptional regulator [Bdellovibrionota bacterium]|nr:helix-turn-helix transcriptional regulator [Bdellovibrionota bacterium]